MGPITRFAHRVSACPHVRLVLLGSLGSLLLAGCAAPPRERAVVQPPAPIETPADRYAADGERIAADPVAFLRQVADKTRELEAYRLTFYRQERLGNRLGVMEEIKTTFRQEPFSVHFEWPDERMPYYESLYVQGRHDNQVIVRERKAALPFMRPTVRSVDIGFPVKIGRAKGPVTDFGMQRMIERTLVPLDDPQVARNTTLVYQGIVNLEPMELPAHHLRIDRPKTPGLHYTHQDLYFDAETLLPAGTDLYLPGDVLDARYRYAHVDTNVTLTDDDFRLREPQPEPAAAD